MIYYDDAGYERNTNTESASDMRFYIEAYDINNSQILGNLDGQAAFSAVNPTKTKHWKKLYVRDRIKYNRVHRWHLVNAKNELLATCVNIYHGM